MTIRAQTATLFLFAMLTASCGQSAMTTEAAAKISCNPDKSAAPKIPAAKTWVRTAWPVDPKGVYTKKALADANAKNPTAIDIAKDLKLVAGDYVGLQAFGKWYWGADTSPTGPTSNALGAVFVDAKGQFLAPAKSGQNTDFFTPPMYHGGGDTNITQDFTVPADKETIVRVPVGATRILFGVGDSAYGDNSTAGEFGVMVFESNRKSAEPGSAAQALADEHDGEIFSKADIASLLAADPPEAKFFSASPFAGPASADSVAQWRGNYRGNGWAPLRSTYAAKRDTQQHWGWDIFAPQGSAVVAPVWPSYMDVPAVSTSYGNTVVFAFKSGGKRYLLAYAHLNAVEGKARSIAGPEIVGYAGCTGGSVDIPGCGVRYEDGNARGMRNDHVHVGLFKEGTPNANDKFACDPSAFLKWTIR